MPPFPIVDTHVHLWDPRRHGMAWLAGNAVLERPFGLAEYAEATAATSVAGWVCVEGGVGPADGFAEATWLAKLAETEPRMLGIVAAAPVEGGASARPYLAGLRALGPRIKGVRRLLQDEPDPTFCLQPGFIAGVKLLADFGFSFDICIRHQQLAAATELVRRCPGTSFVLDHIGKPAIADAVRDPWRAQIADLAALPNVVCKVSGLVTEAGADWTAGDLAPYVAHVLDVFGPQRVMFGSDWPVATLAASYGSWVEALDDLTDALTPEARRALWADNARRVYRLGAA